MQITDSGTDSAGGSGTAPSVTDRDQMDRLSRLWFEALAGILELGARGVVGDRFAPGEAQDLRGAVAVVVVVVEDPDAPRRAGVGAGGPAQDGADDRRHAETLRCETCFLRA